MSYDFASLFLAPFFGVLLGFAVNYIYQYFKDKSLKSKYLKFFRNEIALSIERLQSRKGKLLPIERWESVVNSGDLRLFLSEETNQLSRAYFGIRNFNYEAIRCRDISVQYNLESDPEKRNYIQSYWKKMTEYVHDREESLLKELQILANEKWFQDT